MNGFFFSSLILLCLSPGFSESPEELSAVTLSNGQPGIAPVLNEDHSNWAPVEYVKFPHPGKPVVHKFKPTTVPPGYFRHLAAEQRRKLEAEADARREAFALKRKGQICGFCAGLVTLMEKVVEVENSFDEAKTPLRFGCGILESQFKDLLPTLDCKAAESKLSHIGEQHSKIQEVAENAESEILKTVQEKKSSKCTKGDCEHDKVKVSLGGCSFFNIGFCNGEGVLHPKSENDNLEIPFESKDTTPVVATPIIVAPVDRHDDVHVHHRDVHTKPKRVLEAEPVKKKTAAPINDDESDRKGKINSLESQVKSLKKQNENIIAALNKWETYEEEELQEEEEDMEDAMNEEDLGSALLNGGVNGKYKSEGKTQEEKMKDIAKLHRFREILEQRYNEEQREIDSMKHRRHGRRQSRKYRH